MNYKSMSCNNAEDAEHVKVSSSSLENETNDSCSFVQVPILLDDSSTPLTKTLLQAGN